LEAHLNPGKEEASLMVGTWEAGPPGQLSKAYNKYGVKGYLRREK